MRDRPLAFKVDENLPEDVAAAFPDAGHEASTVVGVTILGRAELVVPFLSYTTKDAWWSVPINAVVSKVFKIGGQLVSVAGGVRYWAESPDNGPEGFGFRVVLTLLFPR